MTNVTPATTLASGSSAKHGTSTSTGAVSPQGAVSSQGVNTIADGVVEKVAGIAARQVPGVHDLGGGAARAIGAIRNAINAQDRGQGISVEVGEKQVAADITVVAEYPVALQKLADSIRSAVSEAISSVVGMEVTEINVTVADVYIPSDDKDEDTESRVK